MADYPGKPGQVAVHRDGHAVVLSHRKTGSAAVPMPGWWLHGAQGGLADRALNGPDWVLVDGAELFQLLAAVAALPGGDDPTEKSDA